MSVSLFNEVDGTEYFIASYATEQEANKAIAAHSITKQYNQPFWRMWQDEQGRTVVDVGSYSCFFIIDKGE